MNPYRLFQVLCLITLILLIITSSLGLFWDIPGEYFGATTLDGREIELYGKGAYANHSILRAASYIGADLTIFALVVPLLSYSLYLARRSRKGLLLTSGLLMISLYYSISLAFGAAINRFFLLYILLFAFALTAFIHSVCLTGKETWKLKRRNNSENILTSIFLLLAGFSALVWLTMLIPAITSGDYSKFIDINTTEPTFVLDIGIIFPLFTYAGLSLMKAKEIGYRLTPILLTFYSLVGAMVSIQTVIQLNLGIEIPIKDAIGLIFSFIFMGVAALLINIRFLRRIKSVN